MHPARTSGAGGGCAAPTRSPPAPSCARRANRAPIVVMERQDRFATTDRLTWLLAARMTPPPGRSTASTRSRPAPSNIDARPTNSASSRDDIPIVSGGHGLTCAARGSRPGSATTRAITSLMRDDRLELRQGGARSPGRRAPGSPPRLSSSARPPMHHHAAASVTMTASRSVRPLPLQRLDALRDFQRIADRAAERRLHRRDEASVRMPLVVANRHQRARQRQRLVRVSS